MTTLSNAPTPRDVIPKSITEVLTSVEVSKRPEYAKVTKTDKHANYVRAVEDSPSWWPNHSAKMTWVLMFDHDRTDSVLDLFSTLYKYSLPEPAYIVETANGHCHFGYVIEQVATSEKARDKPQQFAKDVLNVMTHVFGTDVNYSNTSGHNPFFDWTTRGGRVIWGTTKPYTLGELKQSIVDAGLWDDARRATKNRRTMRKDVPRKPHGSRNCWVFDRARLRMSGDVRTAAWDANQSLNFPLDAREVETIIRSIERYENRTGRRGGSFMSAQERAKQAERGRKGGLKNTDAQQQARARGPRAATVIRQAEAVGRHSQIQALFDAGMTRKQIMAKLEISESTVKRALRDRHKISSSAHAGAPLPGGRVAPIPSEAPVVTPLLPNQLALPFSSGDDASTSESEGHAHDLLITPLRA